MSRGRIWAAVTAMAARDARIFFSYRGRWVSALLTMLFTLTLFHFLAKLVHAPGLESPQRYFSFVVGGVVILEILTSTLALPPASARTELVAHTFERLALSPAGPVTTICGLMAFPFCMAFVTGTATLVVSALLFGLELHWATVPLAAPIAALGAAAFAPFGLLLLASSLLFKQTVAGVTFVISGISLLAGVYFPTSVLPDWSHWLTEIQPFTPAVDLLRRVLLDTPSVQPPSVEVIKLVAFAVIGSAVAVRVLGAALSAGRRRGTLLEY